MLGGQQVRARCRPVVTICRWTIDKNPQDLGRQVVGTGFGIYVHTYIRVGGTSLPKRTSPASIDPSYSAPGGGCLIWAAPCRPGKQCSLGDSAETRPPSQANEERPQTGQAPARTLTGSNGERVLPIGLGPHVFSGARESGEAQRSYPIKPPPGGATVLLTSCYLP